MTLDEHTALVSNEQRKRTLPGTGGNVVSLKRPV
jgi:hypothetical protein